VGSIDESVDGLFEKVSFQMAFEGVENVFNSDVRGIPFWTKRSNSLNDLLRNSMENRGTSRKN